MKPPTVVAGPVYHATLHVEIGAYHPGTHFGTKAAAEHRLKDVLELSAECRTSFVVSHVEAIPTVHAVHLDICNPFDMEDPGEWWPEHYAAAMRAAGHPVSQEDLARWDDGNDDPHAHLARLGYDGIRYRNANEDRGSTSWIIFYSKQVTPA